MSGMTRLGAEVVSASRYIDEQDDFGPMTKAVLKQMVVRVAEAAIRDVEDMASRAQPDFDPGPIPTEEERPSTWDELPASGSIASRLSRMAAGWFG